MGVGTGLVGGGTGLWGGPRLERRGGPRVSGVGWVKGRARVRGVASKDLGFGGARVSGSYGSGRDWIAVFLIVGLGSCQQTLAQRS